MRLVSYNTKTRISKISCRTRRIQYISRGDGPWSSGRVGGEKMRDGSCKIQDPCDLRNIKEFIRCIQVYPNKS